MRGIRRIAPGRICGEIAKAYQPAPCTLAYTNNWRIATAKFWRYGGDMTWQDYLSKKERAELERAERKRDDARAEYNALRVKLKSRADNRRRKERASEKD